MPSPSRAEFQLRRPSLGLVPLARLQILLIVALVLLLLIRARTRRHHYFEEVAARVDEELGRVRISEMLRAVETGSQRCVFGFFAERAKIDGACELSRLGSELVGTAAG